MAAVRGSSGSLCHLSYIGALNANKAVVTAIKITTKTREIIATLPSPGASLQQAHFSIKEQTLKLKKKSHQEHTKNRLVLSQQDLLHMNVQLELTSKTAYNSTTTFLPVQKPPPPKLRGRKEFFMTVQYPKEQCGAAYVTFTLGKKPPDTENAPSPIFKDFLLGLNILTKDLSSDASFNKEEPNFCLLITTLEHLKTLLQKKTESFEGKDSEKEQADLLPKASQKSANIEPSDDLKGRSGTIKALLSQTQALIATLQQGTTVDLNKSTVEQIQKNLQFFDKNLLKAHQQALINRLTEKHRVAEQLLADADKAYTQASDSKDQTAIAAAVQECCNQIANFNEVVKSLREHNIKTKTFRYTHLNVSPDSGLVNFNNPFLAIVLSSQ